VIVTSNYLPSEIWEEKYDKVLLGAIEDRFYVINGSDWEVRRDETNTNRWEMLKASLKGPRWTNNVDHFPNL